MPGARPGVFWSVCRRAAGKGRRDLNALSPQILGKVYSVLSDKEQRAVYDEQGTVDEDSDVLSQDRDWETYWRLLFKKVEIKIKGRRLETFATIPIMYSTNVY